MASWASRTADGSLSDLPSPPSPEVWDEVSAESDLCPRIRCEHFDRRTRLCDSYDTRPGMCRDYPRALLWQPRPEMLPGCGYRPVNPRARALASALDAQPLTDEQRAKLAKGLFLDG